LAYVAAGLVLEWLVDAMNQNACAMKKTAPIVLLSQITIFVMLAAPGSMGQASFDPDSLRSMLHSDTSDPANMQPLMDLANGYLVLELYDSSIFYLDQAIHLAIQVGDQDREAELKIMKGKALFYSQGPDQGLDLYKAGYELYRKMGDSGGMARALNGMGVMYQKLGLNDSALSCYIHLATIADRMGYEQVLGMGYVNMGILYQYQDDFDKADYYLERSIELNEKYRPDLVALAYMNKGLIHYSKWENDSALLWYRAAMTIYQQQGNSKMLADLYNNLGNLYKNWEVSDSAWYYYHRSKEMYVQLGDWYTFGQVYHNMALVALQNRENDLALAMLDSCLVTAQETGNRDLESLVYLNRHTAYENKGDYRDALNNYRLYDSLSGFIYNLQKEELMAEMEMKYQSEKKQAQILKLERDNLIKAKQNNIYLFTGIGIIALISFAFLFFRQQVAKDRIIARQRILQLEEEKKMLAAKALVEGQEEERKRIAREIHDGLGVLLSATRMQFSSIAVLTPEAKPLIEEAAKMLDQASNDARKISHNMMPGLLTKLGLFEAVGDLFDQLSKMKKIKVHADIPEGQERLPENKEIMVYRIIQELVNNTLKHARAKNIRLQMKMLTDHLEISYSDDGKGFNFEDELKAKGIGLNSMRSRVNFLKGDMEVSAAPGQGSSYTISIPC
jgi:signal transduction histidine kinase